MDHICAAVTRMRQNYIHCNSGRFGYNISGGGCGGNSSGGTILQLQQRDQTEGSAMECGGWWLAIDGSSHLWWLICSSNGFSVAV
eukprot:13334089-Ditylum_brightwellii.AAC.1